MAVVLAARDEPHLLEIERELISKQIPHKAIREPDAPFLGQIMTIGVVPGLKADLKPHFKKLPLYK